MQKIRLLSDFEIGCIAAGEVIENPSSIIKELVENAIDAKATIIKIFFKQGGIEEIIIIDNGFGMSPDDLSLAFMPHATSKLSNIDELYFKNNIFFGFRGEALSAIAGVAKVSIISRQADVESGFSIIADHGKLFDIELAASNPGTTVTVSHLFEKIPVRKKYLNSIKNQEQNILYVITGLVLSHPKINFFVYKDNKLYKEYQAVENFLLRSYQFISQEKDRYIPIIYEDMYMKLEGLTSCYEYGHYDRSKIFILANNRLIKQYKITQSCIKAYHSENFLKKYPELFLSITVNCDQIDVNVHPRKEEVLFLYQKKIEQLLTEILSKTLESRTKQLFSERINYSCEKIKNKPLSIENKIVYKNKYNNTIEKETSKNILIENKNQKLESLIPASVFKNSGLGDAINVFNNQVDEKQLPELENKLPYDNEMSIQQLLFQEKSDKKYLGVLANTYILLLENESILFIDQHALHEKILYEKYINNFKEKKTVLNQPLLFEERVNITDEQKESLISDSETFNSLGIYYNMFENEISITSCPAHFFKLNISALLLAYAILLYQNKEKSFIEKQQILLHEMAALYGCKNAIKAGDHLDMKEIESLIESISLMENGTYCPHGRPIYYQMTLSQLHTLFKRT